MARAVPSGRDLRKYARLFVRTDHDSDGFISADEARAVFSKSFLPPEFLINIFNQANVSQSPHLSFPEFVAAMHLIREARHTQSSPSISTELLNFLRNFYESPWDLATQGSSKSAHALKHSHESQGNPVSHGHHEALHNSEFDLRSICLFFFTLLVFLAVCKSLHIFISFTLNDTQYSIIKQAT